MAVRMLKETIRVERMEREGSDRAIVEGSVTLPGGLREAARVLASGATVAVQRAEPMQERVGVSGRVSFYALYTQGDVDRVQAIEAGADFTHVMESPGARAQGTCRVRAQVEGVEARTSGGQLTLRATVRLTSRAVSVQPVEAVTGLTDAQGLQTDAQEFTLRRTAARGSEEVLLREEFDLPAGVPIRETLFALGRARVEAVTGGTGRAGVSGTVELEAYHAADDPEHPLVVTRHVIPFEQPVELTGDAGDLLAAEAIVKDVAAASRGSAEEGRTLRAEVLLEVSAQADCMDRLTLLRDAYTTQGESLTLTRTALPCRVDEARAHDEENCRVMLSLPEGAGPVRQVLCAFVAPSVTGTQQTGGRLAAEGTLRVRLIALPAQGSEPVTIETEEPFRQTFAAEVAPGDEISLTAGEAEASVLGGSRIELRCVLRLDAVGERTEPVTVVTDVQPGEVPPEDPGIVLYFLQPGETLWDIAKRYRVAAGEIARLNPDLPEELHAGQSMVVWRRPADAAAWTQAGE